MQGSVRQQLESRLVVEGHGAKSVVGAVLFGPLGPGDDEEGEPGRRQIGERAAAVVGHEHEAGDEEQREPRHGEGAAESERGERRHARQGPEDVPGVAAKRARPPPELLQPLGHDLPQRHEAQDAQDEEHDDGQPDVVDDRSVRRQVIVEEVEVLGRGVLREDDAAQRQRGRGHGGEGGQPGPQQRPAPGPKAADAQAQERTQQDQVREVGEHADLAGQPADQRQLLKEDDERSREELDGQASSRLRGELQTGRF